MNAVKLEGIEPSNLLAFMALLGVMRAVDQARPDWEPCIFWSGPPWRPQLQTAICVSAAEVCGAVDAALRSFSVAYAFDEHRDLKFAPAVFRALATKKVGGPTTDELSADLMAALGSDGCMRDDGNIERTALCAMFGSGHQHFLERLANIARDEPQGRNDAVEALHEALFEPWRYRDETPGFRWAPLEDRRYAYRFGDPGNTQRSPILTVHGANRLAVLGLTCFPTVPAKAGLRTAGFSRRPREVSVSWPLWSVPLTVNAVRRLMVHPQLGNEAPSVTDLHAYGVVEVMRALRIQTGKFFNFTPAQPLWGATA